ncbi:MAG: serine protein kinase, partial [Deltaproteobacteria bacterium]|nr:serine protein kinase [Deltaproteobacteria bacterium]
MSKLDISSLVGKLIEVENYKQYHWEGTFQDYIEIVRKNPMVARNAFQRAYDMILTYGTDSYTDFKKNIVKYKFFSDPVDNGKDAIYGLDVPLMKLVHFFKSAAYGYGTEKRVLLLHGPVGSSKSTIARLLKKGLERYSRTDEGKLYTFRWIDPEKKIQHILGTVTEFPDPMHDEPLKLLPDEARVEVLEELQKGHKLPFRVQIQGDLCPPSRLIYRELMKHYAGDWNKVMSHVRIQRMILSERDRVGIGTFQPKDEKNQDSTELTGDVNYRKI